MEKEDSINPLFIPRGTSIHLLVNIFFVAIFIYE